MNKIEKRYSEITEKFPREFVLLQGKLTSTSPIWA